MKSESATNSEKRFPRLLSLWGPPVLLMLLIFIGSTVILSGDNTSRILVPLLKFLFPYADVETINQFRWVIRKYAHMSEFGLLALLFWRAIVFSKLKPKQKITKWPLTQTWQAWGLTVLYAASDEFHQTFVPSRVGAVLDVGFDTIGASMALLILYVVNKCKGINKKIISTHPE